jgi:hypothetical protein
MTDNNEVESFLSVVGSTKLKAVVPKNNESKFLLEELQQLVGGEIEVIHECEMHGEEMIVIGDAASILKRSKRNEHAEELIMINGPLHKQLYGNILFCHSSHFD